MHRRLRQLAIVLCVSITLLVAVIVTFAWIALLAHSFAVLISWAIRSV
jgi:hypothetical protein